jgi:DNA-binding CsgD family transcriptional regulator
MGINALTGYEGSPLTTTEQRTLESLSRGLSRKEISRILGASKSEVNLSLESLETKLGAGSPKELVAKAIESGLISKPSSWARGAKLPPHNPFMGPPGTSSMHANAASSDATLNPGPGTGGSYKTTIATSSALLNYEFPYALPTIMMPENGSLLGVGVSNKPIQNGGSGTPSVLLMSPFTLEILDSYQLTAPSSGHLAGGIYSYIDNENNLVLVDATGNLRWITSSYDMSTDTGSLAESKPPVFINQPEVVGLVPDYEGKIWYATQGSIESSGKIAAVGFFDPASSNYVTFNLPAGEMVANSISSSPAGVAVATTKALYLFKYSKKLNTIKQVWREEYENSGYTKPGQLSPGTGATPAFFGPKTGYEYIAITDNGATNNGKTPSENFNIFKTRLAADGTSQLVGSVPFLSDNNSGTENAPIAVGKSVFSPSTYGYWYPPSSVTGTEQPSDATFVGGAQRIDLAGIRKTGKEWTSTWQNQNVQSTALPRLSIADEQIYTVLGSYSDYLINGNQVDYKFGAINPKTGVATALYDLGISDKWTGDNPEVWVPSAWNYNTLQMTGVISPDGVFYQGMAAGIFSVEGANARFGTGITSDGYSFTDSVSYDGNGYTYSANAINAADTSQWQGPEFEMQGKANGSNFSWANGQTIKIANTEGQNTLTLFGSAVNGTLTNIDIIVNYADGTTDTWTQSFSDWCDPRYYSGEAVYSTQGYRNLSSGGTDSTTNNVYAYQYSIAQGKQLESITLPFEYNLRILDIDMTNMIQVDISPNAFGITTPPWQVANHQGFDNNGNYYSSFLIAGDAPGTTAQQNNNISTYMPLSWNGISFNIGRLPVSNSDVGGSAGPSNFVISSGQTIDLPSGEFDKLYIAAAGANGNQSGDIIINWADGGTSTWSQTFSDWRNGGSSSPPTGVAGQEVITQGLGVNQLGNITSWNNWIYGYTYDLNGREIDSIRLPNPGNPEKDIIGILGVTLM